MDNHGCPPLNHVYIPRPPLSAFVELFWFYEGYNPPQPKEWVLPTGTVSLVVNLSARYVTLTGAHSEPFMIDEVQRASIIGVHFRPGGAFPFLNLPVDALHNMLLPLEDLWGVRVYSLRDRLLEAETPQAKFQILEQALLAQATQPLGRHPAVSLALKEFQNGPQPRPVSAVVEDIGLSQRCFIQLFKEEVGLTPKLFCRIQRFQEVLCLLETGGPLEWTELALACGYFDQAHFIHDFQAFSGFNPTAYLAQRGQQHRNHVPIQE